MLATCAGPAIPYSPAQIAIIGRMIGGAILAVGVGLSLVIGFNVASLGVLGIGAVVMVTQLWK